MANGLVQRQLYWRTCVHKQWTLYEHVLYSLIGQNCLTVFVVICPAEAAYEPCSWCTPLPPQKIKKLIDYLALPVVAITTPPESGVSWRRTGGHVETPTFYTAERTALDQRWSAGDGHVHRCYWSPSVVIQGERTEDEQAQNEDKTHEAVCQKHEVRFEGCCGVN